MANGDAERTIRHSLLETPPGRTPRAPATPSADRPRGPTAPCRASKGLKMLKTTRASYWLELASIWDRRHVRLGSAPPRLRRRYARNDGKRPWKWEHLGVGLKHYSGRLNLPRLPPRKFKSTGVANSGNPVSASRRRPSSPLERRARSRDQPMDPSTAVTPAPHLGALVLSLAPGLLLAAAVAFSADRVGGWE